MNKSIIVGTLIALAAPAAAKPVDMTGMSCSRITGIGPQTWEFYGDVAIRYYADGSVTSLPRIGEGAYEKYNREGEWTAVYFFFDVGGGVQMRILSRPGKIVRDENPRAPLEIGVYPFNGACLPIWEQS
jgi:hypothetical protein